ncbi:MAG: uncharacterized protein KVP18_001969 [Porospora cf. gigantea A]|uniref:uncharacterized protein n=2 Tax=Porospora cf. gigantea A TaxID=2853593 RepID=UPI00355A6834|nr:MAG: hypothetical protein KVP18_001969 [Porospora cf. gigantea A]
MQATDLESSTLPSVPPQAEDEAERIDSNESCRDMLYPSSVSTEEVSGDSALLNRIYRTPLLYKPRLRPPSVSLEPGIVSLDNYDFFARKYLYVLERIQLVKLWRESWMPLPHLELPVLHMSMTEADRVGRAGCKVTLRHTKRHAISIFECRLTVADAESFLKLFRTGRCIMVVSEEEAALGVWCLRTRSFTIPVLDGKLCFQGLSPQFFQALLLAVKYHEFFKTITLLTRNKVPAATHSDVLPRQLPLYADQYMQAGIDKIAVALRDKS